MGATVSEYSAVPSKWGNIGTHRLNVRAVEGDAVAAAQDRQNGITGSWKKILVHVVFDPTVGLEANRTCTLTPHVWQTPDHDGTVGGAFAKCDLPDLLVAADDLGRRTFLVDIYGTTLYYQCTDIGAGVVFSVFVQGAERMLEV